MSTREAVDYEPTISEIGREARLQEVVARFAPGGEHHGKPPSAWTHAPELTPEGRRRENYASHPIVRTRG